MLDISKFCNLPSLSQGIYYHSGPSEFLNATLATQLIELSSIGGEFTWTNKSVGSVARFSRLNIVFTNLKWIDLWPQSRFEFYRGSSSDHVIMIIAFSTPKKGHKPFRIYESWLANDDFIAFVKERIILPSYRPG